jgi:hypothetical protein
MNPSIRGIEFSEKLRNLYFLATISIVSSGLSIFLGWILSSYYSIDIPGSLMYPGNDGWCDAKSEGIGNHCFGDFNQLFTPSPNDQWPPVRQDNLELVPIGPFFTWFANFLAEITSSRFTLIIFYLVSIYLVILPLILATKKFHITIRFISIAVFGVATYPFLVLIDRLNYLVFTVPILYMLFKYLNTNNLEKIPIVIIILTLIKPQFALLSLVYLYRGKIASFFKIAISQIFFISLFLIAAGKGDIYRVKYYIEAILSYDSLWLTYATNPPNAALSKNIVWVGELFSTKILGHEITENSNIYRTALLAVLFGLVVILILMFVMRNKLTNLELGFFLIILGIFFTSNYVATYYLVIILPLVAVYIGEAKKELFNPVEKCLFNIGQGDNFKYFAVAYFFSITVIVIPNFFYGINKIPNTALVEIITPRLATLFWAIFIVKVLYSSKSRKFINSAV